MDLKDKKVLVVGFGRSGLAGANLLISKGARVTITDLKSESELSSEIAQLEGPARLRLGFHDPGDFQSADLIVLSPGVPAVLAPLRSAKKAEVPILSEVELAFRLLNGQVVGITGSNGKTTTTTLIGQILHQAGRPAAVAGNIGTPLSQSVHQRHGENALFVVELSSFQLETIETFRCQIAVLLNVAPDHLDRYPDMITYRGAKERIFRNQTPSDFAVFNVADPPAILASLSAMSFPFSLSTSLKTGVYVENGHIRIAQRNRSLTVLPIGQVVLRGKHNLENVLASVAVTHLLGIQPQQIARAIRTFRGIEHRLEWVRSYRQVEYFNDSKATNVASAIKAIESFDCPQIVIMGGLDKGMDFSPLAESVSARVRKLILLGRAAGKLRRALADSADTRVVESMAEAVEYASASARPGDVVLLAPACASFDMFEDYEDRGKRFKQLVQNLGKDKDTQMESSQT